VTRGYHRDAFTVEEPRGGRFAAAIERFLSSESFEFQEIAFYLSADGVVCCAVDSSWQPENVTPTTADKDLEEGRAALEYLVQSSPSFADAVRGKPVRYELIHDYGSGSILVCSKMRDVITWAKGFPSDPRGD
jgi:hypothetical protein